MFDDLLMNSQYIKLYSENMSKQIDKYYCLLTSYTRDELVNAFQTGYTYFC